MTGAAELTFDFSANAGAEAGLTDEQLYDHVLAIAELGHQLGYGSAWMVEHHFSDYYPTPSPLMLLSHIAARHPRLGLGTMVLVTPWYDPRRLAEEISMLSILSRGDLHLGLGRGTAPMEYEAFEVDMAESLERFAETVVFLNKALNEQEITFEGEHIRLTRALALRPRPVMDKINFYGALGSPDSAARMAKLELPPLCISYFPLSEHQESLSAWDSAATAAGHATDVSKAIAVNCILADTDEEARALGKKYLPLWFQMQLEHYEVNKDLHRDIPTYEQYVRMNDDFNAFADPARIDPFLDLQLIGSPETVGRRIEEYAEAGFNRFILQCGTPGTPRSLQRETLWRFATLIAPRYSSRFTATARMRAAQNGR